MNLKVRLNCAFWVSSNGGSRSPRASYEGLSEVTNLLLESKSIETDSCLLSCLSLQIVAASQVCLVQILQKGIRVIKVRFLEYDHMRSNCFAPSDLVQG
jgi:hypothetical protein